MTKPNELSELVGRAQGGDQAAFSALVERFQDMAYGYAYAILGDFPLAEDAVQEAFIEAYRALPGLREAVAFPAWFKRIVFKHCDRLTRGKHPAFFPLETGDEIASTSPGLDEIADQKETGRRVRDAIGSLPLPDRVATTLFYIDGYSQNEIAEFLEVPVKTVKSRLHASRKRLRERMLDMVQEEFSTNALPAGFTRQTVEEAVTRAKELNQNQQYDQAEQVLRQALTLMPDHPTALKELNRALMRGQVFSEGRWDLLPELARQGQLILQTSEEAEVYSQLAQTMLAIPAMKEAVQFLEGWIARKGPDLERLGMLAWAKGCCADYTAAESRWLQYLALARQSKPETVIDGLRFVCYTLVDCLAEASQVESAQRIAREGWQLARQWLEVPRKEAHNDWYWLALFKQAGLDYGEIAQSLRTSYGNRIDPEGRGAMLSLSPYVDDPQTVIAGWVSWVGERVRERDWPSIAAFRGSILMPLRQMGKYNEQIRLAEAIWDQLGVATGPEAEKIRKSWSWERFNYFCHLEAGAWEQVEDLCRRALEAGETSMGMTGLLLAATARGLPTPPELVQAVEERGIEAIDDYGLFGWYLLAREAAAAGDESKAFAALRRSVSYWANSPSYYLKLMEQDSVWGDLRQQPEFIRIFAEKRDQIGPVYGMLHYFPAW